MNFPKLFNQLWLWSQSKNHQEFIENQDNIKDFQLKKLQGYLAKNAETVYGKKHQFSKISSYEEYANLVSIIEDYEQLRPYINSIASGEKNVLTKDDVLFFESTSGSSGNSKWIPYTNQLKEEFQKGVASWMVNTYQQHPEAFHGRSYWSISPPLKAKEITSGGLKVGIHSDTEYFNYFDAFVLSQIMTVSSRSINAVDANSFYFSLCKHLLADEKLSFISVWSPNYLLQLNDFMLNNWEEIITDLPNKRKHFLLSIGKDATWQQIFPKLKLLSCWTEAQSQIWLPQIEKMLGDITIQPKGLLSTEGVTTIPFEGKNALAYTAHFYEFRDIASGKVLLCNELDISCSYEVILTTGGGLYRYNTHDLVTLESYKNQLPMLHFIGKSNDVSDLVGEKISPQQLYPIFSAILASGNSEIKALYLHPIKIAHQISYELIIECSQDIDIELIGQKVEAHLDENPYYLQSRNSRQLLPLKTKRGRVGFTKALLDFYKKTKQIKDGDIKLPILYKLDELTEFLTKIEVA